MDSDVRSRCDNVADRRAGRLTWTTSLTSSTPRDRPVHPKALAVSHRGLANVCATHLEMFETGTAMRILQLASPTFDASVLEFMIAPGALGTLVLAPEYVFAGAELTEFIVSHAITHLIATPTVLSTLDPNEIPSLTVESAGRDVERGPGGAVVPSASDLQRIRPQ